MGKGKYFVNWAHSLLMEGEQCAKEYDEATERARPWYDHRFNWLGGPGRWARWERAVYGARYLRPGNVDRVLDLCCGDGFFSWCIGQRAASVDGLDENEDAIEHARRYYQSETVQFDCMDVSSAELGKYDLIMWWDAIEHFSLEGIHTMLGKLVESLEDSPNGRLVGSTPRATGRETNADHRHEFKSQGHLHDLLRRYFVYVETWESPWNPRRTQLYFMCQGTFHVRDRIRENGRLLEETSRKMAHATVRG